MKGSRSNIGTDDTVVPVRETQGEELLSGERSNIVAGGQSRLDPETPDNEVILDGEGQDEKHKDHSRQGEVVDISRQETKAFNYRKYVPIRITIPRLTAMNRPAMS